MNLGTSLKSLEPQFPHLQEDDNVTSLAYSHLAVVRIRWTSGCASLRSVKVYSNVIMWCHYYKE